MILSWHGGWARTPPPDRSAARKVYGVLIVVAGCALLLTGIATQLIVLGVAGFLLAATGAYLLSAPALRRHP